MEEQIRLLCVDDEKNVLRSLKRTFFEEDFEVLTADSARGGIELLESERCQIVISDYRMPNMSGVEFLREVRKQWPETVRIVLSGYAEVASIVEAINEGEIYKFVPKPWNDDELKVTVANAIEKYRLEQENRSLNEELTRKNHELEDWNKNLEAHLQKKTRDILIQNKALQQTQNIIDIVPIGIIGLDNDANIVYANSLAAALFSPEYVSLLGEAAENILRPGTLQSLQLLSGQTDGVTAPPDPDFNGEIKCFALKQKRDRIGSVVVFIPHAD